MCLSLWVFKDEYYDILVKEKNQASNYYASNQACKQTRKTGSRGASICVVSSSNQTWRTYYRPLRSLNARSSSDKTVWTENTHIMSLFIILIFYFVGDSKDATEWFNNNNVSGSYNAPANYFKSQICTIQIVIYDLYSKGKW